MSERDLRYPIGRFHAPESVSQEARVGYVETIASAPARLRDTVRSITTKQLDTPYREGGWTVRQVIHHIPDSHMNAYIRFKMALTETEPVIKPYDEAAWAQLRDTADTPLETSLALLAALHQRWTVLMRGLSAADWRKQFIHPEDGRGQTLEQTLASYAWHCDHHLAHVNLVVG